MRSNAFNPVPGTGLGTPLNTCRTPREPFRTGLEQGALPRPPLRRRARRPGPPTRSAPTSGRGCIAGFPNPRASRTFRRLRTFHALPIRKSAIQQVWKPALRRGLKALRSNVTRPRPSGLLGFRMHAACRGCTPSRGHCTANCQRTLPARLTDPGRAKFINIRRTILKSSISLTPSNKA